MTRKGESWLRENKANFHGRDCFPCLRRGRLAGLLAMTGTCAGKGNTPLLVPSIGKRGLADATRICGL